MVSLIAEGKPRWSERALGAVGLAVLVATLLFLSGTSYFRRLVEGLAVIEGGDLLLRHAEHSRLSASVAAAAAPALPNVSLARAAAHPLPDPPQLTPPQPQPLSCNIPIQKTPFADSCTLLQDVCVDQGRLILYDPRHRPNNKNGPPVNLPVLTPAVRQKRFYFPYREQNNNDMRTGLPPIHARAASSREPRQYLADPTFSNCTVPVVFYQHNSFNFAHIFRDNAARFYSALAETAWAGHVRIVLMTGEGLPISGMARALWQPLSRQRVTSWDEFSVRLPDGQVGAGAPLAAGPDGLPPSFEGSEQRCFRSMYVCLHDIDTQHWQIHAYGRHLSRYYGADKLLSTTPEVHPPAAAAAAAEAAAAEPAPSAARKLRPGQLQQQGQQGAAPALPPPVSILQQLGTGGKGQQAGREVTLRVVFSKRSSPDRQLLNAAELVRRCNSWRTTAPSGASVRALCWEVETPTLQAGIAAAQLADIWVGPHGANLANGYMLRPGGAVIELTMFGFEDLDGDAAHTNLARRNFADTGSGLSWWKLLLCDPKGSWTPGTKESKARLAGTPIAQDASKYRNLVVRWEALQVALQAAVSTAGDTQRYRQQFEAGRWWWLSSANETVAAGPNVYQSCVKARKQGLIH